MPHLLEPLDRRHNGHGRFKYRVEIGGSSRVDRVQNFNEIREWCWQIWGGSGELENTWSTSFKDQRSVEWCWRCHPDERSYYIYLRDDGSASFFKLKWM